MASLYTLPPSGARFVGINREAVNSLNTSVVRSFNIASDSTTTDSLQNRRGENIVDGEYVLFEQSASAKEAPPSGSGRIWVRGDDVKKLIFTSDSSGDVELTPGLGDMLAAGNNAGTLSITDVDLISFHDAIRIGTQTQPAVASSNMAIAIGEGATANAVYSVVVGAGSQCDNAYGLVVGSQCTLNAIDSQGGIVIGSDIVSHGLAICVGNNIQNVSTVQQTNPSIILGSGFTDVSTGGNAIAIGHGLNALKSVASYSIAIGSQDNDTVSAPLIDVSTHSHNISIGYNSFCFGSQNVAIGSANPINGITLKSSIAGGDGNVVLGGHVRAASEPLALPGVNFSTCIGSGAQTQSSYNVCIGVSYAYNCDRAICIGSGYNVFSSFPHEDSVAIGYKAKCTSNFAVCLGSYVVNRVQDELSTRFSRSVRGTLTTVNDLSTTLVAFQTVANDVLHVEATINGVRDDHLVTYMAVFENYHFRNKAGTLSMSPLVGTKTEDITDGATGFVSLIQAAAGLIELKVTGRSGEIVNWIGVLRIYGAPLS